MTDLLLLHEWCAVPTATFPRGSEESPDEQPISLVSLSAYEIGRTPVTNAQYREFVRAGGYDRPELWTPPGWEQRQLHSWTEPNYWHDPAWSESDCPVTGVSWWEARAFAQWARACLTTEAQWEYAAKGPACRRYPWGDSHPTLDLATFADECEPLDRRGTPVDAHRSASPFGCVDMAGNVAEWCLDNARPTYDGDPDGIDPVYLTDERDEHIVRGGCGLHDPSYLRCTSRDYYPPGLRDNIVGFRLVRRVPGAIS
jgi:formylglycine-generating enzyme required for sulfatase activity